jgi:hypothetical protein
MNISKWPLLTGKTQFLLPQPLHPVSN